MHISSVGTDRNGPSFSETGGNPFVFLFSARRRKSEGGLGMILFVLMKFNPVVTISIGSVWKAGRAPPLRRYKLTCVIDGGKGGKIPLFAVGTFFRRRCFLKPGKMSGADLGRGKEKIRIFRGPRRWLSRREPVMDRLSRVNDLRHFSSLIPVGGGGDGKALSSRTREAAAEKSEQNRQRWPGNCCLFI